MMKYKSEMIEAGELAVARRGGYGEEMVLWREWRVFYAAEVGG